ncbi:hypothetical protein [Paraburkholderia sp. RL17-337-BIB-A]|uniref:hypothetical protein n=1 Tax=Paraburkholderia sp. RL17-337-BIB-A TaxID=3031636 RepID=UPI0038BC7C95
MTSMYLADNGKLVRFDRKPYAQEKQLQDLLSQFPELLADGLPGPDDSGRSRWLRIKDEFPLSDGNGSSLSVDHLFIDQQGIPTLVEDKRSSNPQNRREVVAQMLDYASIMLTYDVRDIQNQFRADRAADADVQLAEFLCERDAENFWKSVQTNLEAGRIRLVFVADKIPVTLRRLIEFLNERLDVEEVVGIEIQRLEFGGREAFVPSVIGRTARAQRRKSAEAGSDVLRSVDDFFELARNREKYAKGSIGAVEGKQVMLANLARVRDWGQRHDVEFAVGSSSGINPRLTLRRADGQPLFGIFVDGGVYLLSNALKNDSVRLEELGKRLQEETGAAKLRTFDSELCKLFELSPEALDRFMELVDATS